LMLNVIRPAPVDFLATLLLMTVSSVMAVAVDVRYLPPTV